MNINNDNYELWLLRYAEQELTAEERQAVEAWLDSHPEAAEELALYGEAPRLAKDENVKATAIPLHSAPLWPAALRWAAAATVATVLMVPAMQQVVAPKVPQIAQATVPNKEQEVQETHNTPSTQIIPNTQIIPSTTIQDSQTPLEQLAELDQTDTLDIPENPELPEPTALPASIEYVDNLIVFEDEMPAEPSMNDILAAADNVTYTRTDNNINPIGLFISTFTKANR